VRGGAVEEEMRALNQAVVVVVLRGMVLRCKAVLGGLVSRMDDDINELHVGWCSLSRAQVVQARRKRH
jgi:broad specificity phosphatase PhoE